MNLQAQKKVIVGGRLSYQCDDDIMERLAQMHGCSIGKKPINDCGVFMHCQKVEMRESPTCNATIYLAKTPRGWWLTACSYAIHDGGYGARPSICKTEAFSTRSEALEHELKIIMKECDRIIMHGDYMSKTGQKQAKELKKMLITELNKIPQPSLFN